MAEAMPLQEPRWFGHVVSEITRRRIGVGEDQPFGSGCFLGDKLVPIKIKAVGRLGNDRSIEELWTDPISVRLA
jgi:hypothetical protein